LTEREQRVKKILAAISGLLLVGVVVLGATSYWFGIQTEREYQTLLQQSSQLGVAKFVNEKYQRGIFGSTARTTVELRAPGGARNVTEMPVRFTLVHDIKHGPLLMGAGIDGKFQAKPALGVIITHLELSPEIEAQLQEALGAPLNSASIENYTIFFLAGNGASRFVVSPFHNTIGKHDKATVHWEGLKAQLAFAANFKGFTGSLSVPALDVAGKDGEFKMERLESTFDAQEGLGGLPLGKGVFQVAKFEFSENKGNIGERFTVKNLKMESSSQASGDNINYELSILVDQVAANAAEYGPGVFKLELRKLDAASLARLQQVLRQMQGQMAQSDGTDPNQMTIAQSMEVLAGLLKKSPEIEITQFSVKTGKGDLEGKAKIAFDGSKGASVTNPLTLLNAISAQAEISAADRLVQEILEMFNKNESAGVQAEAGTLESDQAMQGQAEQSQELLQALEAQNIIIHENGNYKAIASYQQGKAMLNGRPIPLQNLLP
jgi:uncharacterized protein YdgA (DUF945 family)